MLRASLGAGLGWLGISMVSDGLPALLLPHQVTEAGGGGATSLGIITLVAIAVAAAIQPAAGRAGDRIGRVPVMLGGTALAAASMAAMLVPGMAPFGAVGALAGVSVAQAGYQPLLPDRIGHRWRGRASGMKGAFDVVGASLGFALLALLLGSGQPAIAVTAMTGALAAGLIAGTLLVGRTDARPAYEVDGRIEPAPGPALVRLVVARFLFLLGIYVVGRFLLLFIAERQGLGADAAGGEAGTALATLALLTAVASLPSGWLADRGGRRALLLAGGALAGAGIALMPLASSTELIVAFGGMMALGTATFGAASWAMQADMTASRQSGELLGLANLGTAGAAAGAGAFGMVIDLAGYGPAFLVAAACSVAGGLLAWQLDGVTRHDPQLIGQKEAG